MVPNNDEQWKFWERVRWRNVLILMNCLLIIHFLLPRLDHETTILSEVTPSSLTSSDSAFGKPPATVESAPVYATSDVDDISEDKSFENKHQSGNPESDVAPADEYLAICISVKDQADDLVEFFVHHYHHIGIRRFYVMDDGSDPPLSSYKYPGIPSEALTFTFQDRATRRGHMQMIFYQVCLERYATKHTWMAFIDGDEFLETPGNETLKQVLQTFEKDESVGALGVNWKIHTSSGLLTRPESTRKSFITCADDDLEHNGEGSSNSHIKSIVKTSHGGPPANPHKFHLRPGTNTVGENGDEVTTIAFRKPPTRNRVSLHHYVTKSREEFEAKMHRGNGMSDSKDESTWDYFETVARHINCTEMVKYNP